MTEGSQGRCDTSIVVVGAGPAGATLSYLLVREGIDVTLIERRNDLSREFRGFSFPPPALSLFEEMGILEDVLSLQNTQVQIGQINSFGRIKYLISYSGINQEYNYDLHMEQSQLLELLIEKAENYDNFTFLKGTRATDLVTDDKSGIVQGVEIRPDSGCRAEIIQGQLVVDASGRFSSIRDSVGIDPSHLDSDIELLWFKVKKVFIDKPAEVKINRNGILYYFELNDEVQIASFLPKGKFRELKQDEDLFEYLISIDQRLSKFLPSTSSGFKDYYILDIKLGIADEWSRDGLILIGDAVHIASPLGGIGNLLAIQDAVMLSPIIIKAISKTPSGSTIIRDHFVQFEKERRSEVEQAIATQRRKEKLLSFYIRRCRDFPPQMLELSLRLLLSIGKYLTPLAEEFYKYGQEYHEKIY